jgi:Domain of unknown function (DUF4148)
MSLLRRPLKWTITKSKFIAGSTVIHALILFAGSPACAQVTREQVQAELAEAIRTGDIVDDPVFWRVKGGLRQAA